jgi:hypothetical protein
MEVAFVIALRELSAQPPRGKTAGTRWDRRRARARRLGDLVYDVVDCDIDRRRVGARIG